MEKISIGIPTYNRPDYLKQTLETLLKQSHSNIEIIISDNCSPNKKVKAVIEEFEKKDSRIKGFIQKKNIGMVPNFEFVLEKSTSDYFMWKADDDIIEDSDFISKLYKKLTISNCDFVFPEGYYLLKDGSKKSILNRVYGNCSSNYDYLNAFTRSFSCLEFYGLYNLKKFKGKHELKISDEVVCPDWKYLPYLFLNHSVSFVPETYYIYRHVPNDDTFHRNLNMFKDRQTVMRELITKFAATEILSPLQREEIAANMLKNYEYVLDVEYSMSKFTIAKTKLKNKIKGVLGIARG